MHNNSEGLSPSLRAEVGVGWNRSLPAPFDFANGIQSDGSNDEFQVYGSIIGTVMPANFTIEWWMIASLNTTNRGVWCISGENGKKIMVRLQNNVFAITDTSNTGLNVNTVYATGSKIHYVLRKTSAGGINVYRNAVLAGSGSFDKDLPDSIQSVQILNDHFNSRYPHKMDEFRLYDRYISNDEIVTNYNSGSGNNPSRTEGLIFWTNFHKAESDGSLWSGSNPVGWAEGVWGLRDLSNNNSHAKQIGMANNPTLGGSLQPF